MIRVCDASQNHLKNIEKIEHECFSVPWTEEQLLSQFPDDSHIFIVAEDENGEAVGYVGLMYVLDEGYISNVAVTAGARRRGIGDKLLDELEKRANDKSLSFMTLEVRESNEPAIKLYSKHGFVRVGLRKNYYDLPRENAVLMTKNL